MDRTKRIARIVVMLSAATLILLQSAKIHQLRESRAFWISMQKHDKFWMDQTSKANQAVIDCLDREMKRQ